MVTSPAFRRHIFLAVTVLITLVILYRAEPAENLTSSITDSALYFIYGSRISQESLPYPEDYYDPPPLDDFCENMYGLGYLRKYRDSRKNYCEKAKSISDLTCFQIPNHQNILQPFCVAEHVLFDPSDLSRPFQIDCHMRDFPAKGPDRALPLGEFPEHFAHTGPGPLLVDNFAITNDSNPILPDRKAALQECAKRPKSNTYTILLKRDAQAPNHHWHSLWEIFSLYLSLDVLQITPRNGSRSNSPTPFFTAADILNAQIVIMDDKPLGMMGSLWSMFAKQPIVYLADLSPNEKRCLDNVLLPIPGSANIIWSGDWFLRNCTESKLVDTFVKRIMRNYNVSYPVDTPGTAGSTGDKDSKDLDRRIQLTFISRKSGHRRIRNRSALVRMLRERFPAVSISEVDFGDFSYEEQVRIAADSDIMVGTHGGGLTMQLFMRRGSAVVEIKPYDFMYWGFRNMAKFRGSQYFTIHAEQDPADSAGWQKVEEITLDEVKLVKAVGAAVHAVEQRGFLAKDIA